VIVVIGSPVGLETERGIVAAGTAVAIARVAAAAGPEVQLVGKVGEDPAGEAAILSLAADRIGHVALLRDPARPTPLASSPVDADTTDATDAVTDADDAPTRALPPGLPLDPADLQLALRYLPDYRVIVAAIPLDAAIAEPITAAAQWAGAQLIAIVGEGNRSDALPADATILEAPADDPDGAFAAVVGAYAAALDRGASPAEAFASASGGLGVTAVVD
jgi:ribokinase